MAGIDDLLALLPRKPDGSVDLARMGLAGLQPVTDYVSRPDFVPAAARSVARLPTNLAGGISDANNMIVGLLDELGGGRGTVHAKEKPILGSQHMAELVHDYVTSSYPTEAGDPFVDMILGAIAPGVAGKVGRGAYAAERAIAEAEPGPAIGSRAAQEGRIGSVRRARPTVAGAHSVTFPDVYMDPREAAARAATAAAPEASAMPRLFDITRNEVDKLTLQSQDPTLASRIYIPGKDPEHVGQITTPANTRRLTNLLEAGSEEPKLAGSFGWYWSEPLYRRFLKELGPEEGPRAYEQFQQLGAAYSPRSDVATEIKKSSKAYTALRNNRLSEDIYSDPSQMASHLGAVFRLENEGSFLNPNLTAAPKTRVYVDSRTGRNYLYPTGDAHFMRAIGAGDVRPFKTVKGEFGPNVQSIGGTEAFPISEWFAHDVAAPLGMTGSPAQALLWNLMAPATGVKTKLSAPFLELFAKQVEKAAARKGISMDEALREWIRGKGDYLGQNELGGADITKAAA